MPFPWKKSSVSMFSRIMADLQPPNRGNPLVIETGFPTSLVDLFVKNHERLKKPSSKKKRKKKHHSKQQQQELVISDPIPLSSSRDLGELLLHRNNGRRVENLMGQQQQQQGNCSGCQLVSELSPTEKCVDVGVDADADADADACTVDEKHLLWVLLKMLAVVVLGLSTKKLVVGMTMSAFVLIFAEYVGKHILCFLTPYANALLKNLIQSVSSALLILKREKKNCEDYDTVLLIREEEDRNEHVADSCDLVEPVESSIPVEEIQVEEYYRAMVAHLEKNRRPEIDFDLVNNGGRLECLETDTKVVGIQRLDEGQIEVVVSEKGRGRGTKIRATIIKKLVPKKLRGGKKCKINEEKELDLSSEVSSCCGENQLGERIEIVEEHENHARQDLEVYKGQEPLKGLLEEEEQGGKERKCRDFDNGISISSTEVQAPAPVKVIFLREKAESKGKGKSSYLILCVIVLAGLLGGRIIALMLTVVSCLILKFVKNRSPASLSGPEC